MLNLKSNFNKLHLNRFESGIWTVAGVRGGIVTGTAVSATFYSLYMYQERHLPMTLIGLISLVGGLLSGVFQYVGGFIADRYGYRRMLIIYLAVGTSLQAVVTFLVGINGPIWLLAALFVLRPVVVNMSGPIITASIANLSHEKRMAESYALLQIADNLGWAIGPLAGGYILGASSFVWLYGVSTLFLLSTLLMAIFLFKGAQSQGTARLSFRDLNPLSIRPALIVLGLLCMLVGLVMAQWLSTLPVFTVDRLGFSPEQYGQLVSASAAIIVIFQYPIARHLERLGPARSLFLGAFLEGAGFFMFAWITNFNLALVAIAVSSFGETFFMPTLMSVTGNMSQPHERAKNLGFLGLPWALGSSLGPVMGGFLIDNYPANPLFLWGTVGIIGLAAALGFVFWCRFVTSPASPSSAPSNSPSTPV